MKKHFFNLVAVAILLMTVLAACKKDPKGDGGGGGGSFAIEATNIRIVNNDNGIDSVKALIITGEEKYPEGTYHWVGYETGVAKCENNGFRMFLCSTVPDEYLMSAYDDFGELASDRNAKAVSVEIIPYNSAERECGKLLCYDVTEEILRCEIIHTYADRNFTLKGSEGSDYIYTYDCNFRRGWNFVYLLYEDYKEVKITTKRPSGIDLKWHYYSYSYVKKNPKPTKLFPFHLDKSEITK